MRLAIAGEVGRQATATTRVLRIRSSVPSALVTLIAWADESVGSDVWCCPAGH